MSHRPITFADPGRFEIYCHHSPPTNYPEEVHETVQVCIPLENALFSVTRISEGGRSQLQMLGARDVLIIPACQPHAIEWKRPADIVSLQLSQPFVAQAIDQPKLVLRDSCVLRDHFISAAAVQVRAALRRGPRLNPAFAEAMATAIAYRIGVGASAGSRIRTSKHAPPLSAPQVARVNRLIDERLDQRITLAELATVAGLSKWHFMRRFYASHGTSPHDFVTQRRLARAQALLATSDLSITAIALEVGMSHSHFSRTFLDRIGVAPREYRRHRLS
jgi:AraC family transcriptional regulator